MNPKRRKLVLGSLAVLAFLLSAYALAGAAMSGGFYVGSRQRGFETAARIWAVVMAASLIVGIALAVAAWRTGISSSRRLRRDEPGRSDDVGR